MGFREWVSEKWYENVDEHIAYGLSAPSIPSIFFRTNKWHLKRLYKMERSWDSRKSK